MKIRADQRQVSYYVGGFSDSFKRCIQTTLVSAAVRKEQRVNLETKTTPKFLPLIYTYFLLKFSWRIFSADSFLSKNQCECVSIWRLHLSIVLCCYLILESYHSYSSTTETGVSTPGSVSQEDKDWNLEDFEVVLQLTRLEAIADEGLRHASQQLCNSEGFHKGGCWMALLSSYQARQAAMIAGCQMALIRGVS